jgi:hypothetical protein
MRRCISFFSLKESSNNGFHFAVLVEGGIGLVACRVTEIGKRFGSSNATAACLPKPRNSDHIHSLR